MVVSRKRAEYGQPFKLSDKDAHELWNSSQMECRCAGCCAGWKSWAWWCVRSGHGPAARVCADIPVPGSRGMTHRPFKDPSPCSVTSNIHATCHLCCPCSQ